MHHPQKRFRKTLAQLQLAVATMTLIPMGFAQQISNSAAAGVASQAAANTIPNLIRYSGTLKGEQGVAASLPATVGVTFSIYKQQEGGASIWMETQNVTADAGGQYSVLLGSTKTEGVPPELFSDQEQRWLSVQVQGQPEQTRVLLVSVPYALRAHDAETLGGLPASAFAQVSAAPSAPSANESSVPAGAPASRSATPAVTPTGSGTAQYITMWKAAAKLGNSVIYQSTAATPLVGVATTAPSAQLDVSGAINTSPTTTNTNSGNYQILEYPILSIGWPAPISVANNDLYVGYYAGAQGLGGNNGTSDTFVGSQAGLHNLSGSNNTAVGTLSGYRNGTGNNNVSVGVDAAFGVLGINTSNNTVVGVAAGENNTASNIAFFGYQAGENNTGGGNSFVGYQSGLTNTTGFNDTFLGSQAGYFNTTGQANTFVGQGAGQNNTTANGNTFTGQGTGQNTTTGGDNTFDGNGAGNANTTGSLNTFDGEAAGSSNTTGAYNTFSGWAAGLDEVDGQQNAFFGFQTGISMSHGSNNTCLGANACFNGTQGGSTYNGNIMVGYDAGGNNITSSNDIYIGNAGCASPCSENGAVRIGTAGAQTSVYIAGVAGVTLPIAGEPLVCIDPSTGQLGTLNCASNGAVVIEQQRQIKTQAQQIADLQQRLTRLESLMAKQ